MLLTGSRCVCSRKSIDEGDWLLVIGQWRNRTEWNVNSVCFNGLIVVLLMDKNQNRDT